MKVYHVQDIRHNAVIFAETPGEGSDTFFGECPNRLASASNQRRKATV